MALSGSSSPPNPPGGRARGRAGGSAASRHRPPPGEIALEAVRQSGIARQLSAGPLRAPTG
eukprot:977290-Lingulodinium_polyedra.AAC.1